MDVILNMKALLSGGLKNIDKVFGKQILSGYNYDGMKEKKSLKKDQSILTAIYESSKSDSQTYDEFVKELRRYIHRAKNSINRANLRKSKILQEKENVQNI